MEDEIKKRTDLALVAIKQAFGTEADEYCATLFVSHHLEEIPRDYWQQHLGTDTPEPSSPWESRTAPSVHHLFGHSDRLMWLGLVGANC